VSPDLVHWEHRPVAIGPTPVDAEHFQAFARSDLLKQLDRSNTPPIPYDREVCFSGSTVIDNGVPTSDDGMITWKKHPANPVIPHPPAELVDPAVRNQPLVWEEGVLPSPRRWVDHAGKDRAFDGRRRRGDSHSLPASGCDTGHRHNASESQPQHGPFDQ